MAGHSKWKQIKHYKAATDAKRGALFTKLIREITMAAKQGGGDPDGNPRLRTAIETAKGNSMPKENIERAVKKGTGELEGVEYQEILYEGYGPAGVALMIQTVTDNPNRTVAEIRFKLSRGGGNLGAANSVSWMFDRRGQIYLDAARVEEDPLIEAALEAGAEDVARGRSVRRPTSRRRPPRRDVRARCQGIRIDERGDRLDSQEHGPRRRKGRRVADQVARRPRRVGRRTEGRRQLRHGRVGDGEGVTRP